MSYINKASGVADVYIRLKSLSMSHAEREEALHALRLGESVASGVLWVLGCAKHLFASLRPKPGFKREVSI